MNSIKREENKQPSHCMGNQEAKIIQKEVKQGRVVERSMSCHAMCAHSTPHHTTPLHARPKPHDNNTTQHHTTPHLVLGEEFLGLDGVDHVRRPRVSRVKYRLPQDAVAVVVPLVRQHHRLVLLRHLETEKSSNKT